MANGIYTTLTDVTFQKTLPLVQSNSTVQFTRVFVAGLVGAVLGEKSIPVAVCGSPGQKKWDGKLPPHQSLIWCGAYCWPPTVTLSPPVSALTLSP